MRSVFNWCFIDDNWSAEINIWSVVELRILQLKWYHQKVWSFEQNLYPAQATSIFPMRVACQINWLLSDLSPIWAVILFGTCRVSNFPFCRSLTFCTLFIHSWLYWLSHQFHPSQLWRCYADPGLDGFHGSVLVVKQARTTLPINTTYSTVDESVAIESPKKTLLDLITAKEVLCSWERNNRNAKDFQ